MSMMRKGTSNLLIAVMIIALVLAGCSSNSGSNSGSGSQNGGTSTNGGATEPPKKKVEISFWHTYGEADADPINKVVENYNNSQDRIKVNILGGQDATKQLTAISGGAAPDIVLTFWNNIGPWATAGAVMDLSDQIAGSGFDINGLVPAAAERMQVDGKYYAMPFTMSMASSLMYNKAAFQEAGITSPPETTEQLFEYAKQLTKKDASGNITNIGFLPDYPWIDNVFWPIIFGGSWYDDSTGTVTPNAEANVAAIAYQRSFYEEFGNDKIEKFRSGMGQRGTAQDPLLTGQLAMYIGWEYNFKDERAEDGPIGVAPFPYPADKPELKGSGMVSPRAVFIPAKAKHQDEAWEFLQYLMSVDTQVEFSIAAKVIPTVKDALDDQRLFAEDNKTMWSFYERAKSENLAGFPNSAYINEYLQSLSEETEKALKGTLSPQQAMDNVAAKIQPLVNSK